VAKPHYIKQKSLVIVVFAGRKFGGVERRFARLASHLIEKGENVRLFCTADSFQAFDEIRIDVTELNVKGESSVVVFDEPSVGNWFFDKLNRIKGLLRLLFILSKHKNFIHVHLAMNPGLFSTLFSFSGINYSISIVDPYLNFKYWQLKRSVRKSQAIDCLSESIHGKLITMSEGFSLPPVFVSPCSFTDSRNVEVCASKDTDLERDIDVALIAREVPGKGHALFKQSLINLPGISYHITPTDDPFGIMRRSKIFVSLQEIENYPSQALLEAMISGCAIIATDVGETRRLLDETCAVLIPYDPAALAESITYLLKNPSHRKKMAIAGQRRVLSEQTVERFADYFLKLVRSLN
jgi:glycosyltransferase involved in cell wall biosynthesis